LESIEKFLGTRNLEGGGRVMRTPGRKEFPIHSHI